MFVSSKFIQRNVKNIADLHKICSVCLRKLTHRRPVVYKQEFTCKLASRDSWSGATNLSDSFENSSEHNGDESSIVSDDRRQNREHCSPEDAEQQQSFASEPLRQHSTRDLRRHVAIEERRQDDALLVLVPVKFSLSHHNDHPLCMPRCAFRQTTISENKHFPVHFIAQYTDASVTYSGGARVLQHPGLQLFGPQLVAATGPEYRLTFSRFEPPLRD